jgi:hypothetical protein
LWKRGIGKGIEEGRRKGVDQAHEKMVSSLLARLEGKALSMYSDTFGATYISPNITASRADVTMTLYQVLNAKQQDKK